MRMARKPSAVARELLRNFPKGGRKRRRRKKKSGGGSGNDNGNGAGSKTGSDGQIQDGKGPVEEIEAAVGKSPAEPDSADEDSTVPEED